MHILMLCTSLIVVQFSMTQRPLRRSCRRFRDSFVIISHQLPFVNPFSKVFFKLFSESLPCRCGFLRSLDSLFIIAHAPYFVNCEFFQTSASYTNPLHSFVQLSFLLFLFHIQIVLFLLGCIHLMECCFELDTK